MLTWIEAVACGACGGLITEVVVTFGRLHAWQQARHAARMATGPLPRLGAFVDPLADSLSALLRVLLGSAAGWLLHAEITGVYAAVTVGASAPALLAQVGRATSAADVLRVESGSADPHTSLPDVPHASQPGPSPRLPPVSGEEAS
ncbi:hypothetical protein GCM10009727_95990 [Actinomadura napierensis]|uniref:Uncharacterized protein n=1 Tax=Actinomadura napierensis TaxID=267854 RepID=A0ABN3AKX5_9ACTN